MEHPEIIGGKLCIVTDGGTVQPFGIQRFRAQLAQIEASPRELTKPTQVRAETLRQGIALWEKKSSDALRRNSSRA